MPLFHLLLRTRVRVLFRDADSFAKGKAAIYADNRSLSLNETTVDGAPALELILTPQEIKEREDYAVQQNIVILRNRLNSPELAGYAQHIFNADL